jgi:hypothetical protein
LRHRLVKGGKGADAHRKQSLYPPAARE